MNLTKKGWSTIIIIVLIVAAVFGLNFAKNKGYLDKAKEFVAPKDKSISSVEATPEAIKASEDGTPKITVAINTWGGYAPGIRYNNGYGASTQSRFYKEQGILVEFVVMDDPGNMRAAWRKGEVQVMGLATVDSIPAEINELMADNPLMFLLVDYSRGGDAVVVTHDIKRAKDLEGKRVAFLPKSPSHSLLLVWAEADGADPTKIQNVETLDGLLPAQEFKTGTVPAAIMWAPVNEDCLKAVPGSHQVFDTKKAAWAVADVFIASEKYANKNSETLKKFVAGWLKSAGEMNGSENARAEAAKLMVGPMKITEDDAKGMIANARMCTLGDNLQFFGLIPGGITGEEIYNKMTRLYKQALVIKDTPPAWRQVSSSAFVDGIKLSGRDNEAERASKFTAATEEEKSAPAFAQKPAPIHFAFASSQLTDEAKIMIDTYFVQAAKGFRDARVRIEGNTDNIGSAESNKALSFRRANAVANYLVSKYGFDKNRFIVIGNGSDKPADCCSANATEEQRAENRRTEFALLY
jgi:NitT/TauT family transport system substrate-binding protein